MDENNQMNQTQNQAPMGNGNNGNEVDQPSKGSLIGILIIAGLIIIGGIYVLTSKDDTATIPEVTPPTESPAGRGGNDDLTMPTTPEDTDSMVNSDADNGAGRE